MNTNTKNLFIAIAAFIVTGYAIVTNNIFACMGTGSLLTILVAQARKNPNPRTP